MTSAGIAAGIDAARALARAGVPVFLAEPATDENGVWNPEGGSGGCGYRLPFDWERSPADETVLDNYRPGMAVCAVTGERVAGQGLDGLDIDRQHDGEPTRSGLMAAGMWPDTYGTASTPSGGTHELVAPLGVASRNSVRRGLDVKAGMSDGSGRGLLFVAPTIRKSKTTGDIRPYVWTVPPDLAALAEADDDSGRDIAELVRATRRPSPDESEPYDGPAFADMPPAEVDKIGRYVAGAVDGIIRELVESASWPEGYVSKRHEDDAGRGWERLQADAAYRLGRLARASWNELTTAQAEAAFTRAAPTCATWTAVDVAAKWRSQFRRSRGKPAPYPAALAAEAEWMASMPDGSESMPPEPDAVAEFWSARASLQHVHDFARARRAAPWATLGAVLARVVVSVPPHVVLPPLVGTDASLNLFVAVVAASGGGKGAAGGAAADAFQMPAVTAFPVGSGEGLTHLFVKRVAGEVEQHTTAVLADVAEVDTLAALTSRQGATLQPVLRQAFMGEMFGFGYADPAKRLVVGPHAYRLALIVGVQPKRAATLLDDTDGGTPQRFVWLPAVDRDSPDTAPALPARLRWNVPRLPAHDIDGRVRLPVCAAARVAVDSARLARLRGTSEGLDGHALLARLKVAAALGLLDGHVEVTDEDWQLAGTMMLASDATRGLVVAEVEADHRKSNRARGVAEADRAEIVTERVEASAVARVGERLARKIGEAGAAGIAGGALRSKLASRDRALLDDALDSLLDAGRIVAEDVAPDASGSGGIGRRYRTSESGS